MRGGVRVWGDEVRVWGEIMKGGEGKGWGG